MTRAGESFDSSESRSARDEDSGAVPDRSTEREIREAVEFGLMLLCASGGLPWTQPIWKYRMLRDGKRALKYARALGWDELSHIDKDCTDNGTRIQQADREPRAY